MTKVLLLVDVQNEHFADGAAELPEMAAAAANCAALLKHFRAESAPIIHLQHTSLEADADRFAYCSAGWELHPDVAPQPGEAVVPKYFANGFRLSWLLATLHQVQATEIVFAGAMTQSSIDSTLRTAHDYGFRCVLASDACAAKAIETADRTIAASEVQDVFLAALGEFAHVAPTAELIDGEPCAEAA